MSYDSWKLAAPADYPSDAEAHDLPYEVDEWIYDHTELGGSIVSAAWKGEYWHVEINMGDKLQPWIPGPIQDLAVWDDGRIMTLEVCERCDAWTTNDGLCDDCLADHADTLEYRGEL